VIGAVLFGIALPMTPLQILWVNMITAVTLALALAFEPTEPDIMKRPPRPVEEPLLTGFLMWRIAFVSVALVSGTFGLFLWEEAQGVPIDEARTVAVNTLVLFEVFYLFSSRFIMRSIFTWEGLVGNPYVLLTSALVIGFQMLFTYAPPMQQLFTTADIGWASWGRILIASVAVLLLVEAEKLVWRLIRGKTPSA
jgi:magnesium-transporting ATPase (P-type)